MTDKAGFEHAIGLLAACAATTFLHCGTSVGLNRADSGPDGPSSTVDVMLTNDVASPLVDGATVDAGDVTVPIGDGGTPFITQVSVGSFAVCAVSRDGNAWCWGLDDGADSNLGFPAPDQCANGGGAPVGCALRPHQVPSLSGVTAVEVGTDICALASGNVDCWGSPSGVTAIAGLSDAVSVSAFYGYAVVASGSVYELAMPATPVAGLSNIVQVAGDGFIPFESGAVRNDGAVLVWANDSNGGGVRVPTALSGIQGAVQVALGGRSGCARLSNGTVQCWQGILGGVGTQPAPLAVPGVSSAVDVTVDGGSGQTSTTGFIVLADGSVLQLGFGDPMANPTGWLSTRALPYFGSGSELGLQAAHISADGDDVCVVTSIGSVSCWGDNTFGMVGDGTQVVRFSPVSVAF